MLLLKKFQFRAFNCYIFEIYQWIGGEADGRCQPKWRFVVQTMLKNQLKWMETILFNFPYHALVKKFQFRVFKCYIFEIYQWIGGEADGRCQPKWRFVIQMILENQVKWMETILFNFPYHALLKK